MINYVYQLVSPRLFSIKYDEMELQNEVIIRPEYMSICHADQRYYQGIRGREVLEEKLPMALIHEFCGRVVYDPTGEFKVNELVTVIPNVPSDNDETVYENYRKGSVFRSSGCDGFMQEFVSANPNRVLSLEGISPVAGSITEFVSVAAHAITRFNIIAGTGKKRVGIWGDGSLGYVVANLLRHLYKDIEIVVIGRNVTKLSYFAFVDETYTTGHLPKNFEVDHAFECCGGDGSVSAIDEIIDCINPQGTIMLLGVSENKVSINTRMILEKGITCVGCSRSGKEDFQVAINALKDKKFQSRISQIIYEDEPVKSVDDIHRVFRTDAGTLFKTSFRWEF